MVISAADVNKLRKQTGAGIMDCKKALEETQGDFEAAIDFLRKKGKVRHYQEFGTRTEEITPIVFYVP